MASSVALNSVYNYYSTSYASRKEASRFDTHKRSELRNICKAIVKLNKEAPLVLYEASKNTRQFAVGIKEDAREFHNTLVSLGSSDDSSLLNKKIAFSSNPDIATAEYIGAYQEGFPVPSFSIEVTSLAQGQINIGNYLSSSEAVGLDPNTYSFDLKIGDLNYEFQFAVHENDTNGDIQKRLAKLFNNANVGLNADILDDAAGNTALRISSAATGLPEGKKQLFSITDGHTSRASGTVSYLGLDYMARSASNSSFLLNGEERTSYSNKFTVDKTYELSLNGVSPSAGECAYISLKTDVDSMADNVITMVKGYNTFLENASGYADIQPKSNKLVSDMKGIVSLYTNELDAIGLSQKPTGLIKVDRDMLRQSAMDEEAKKLFEPMEDLRSSLLRKTDQISLDPMQYVNTKVVVYKNPGKNFPTPYILSTYSGMMFNSYC